MLLAMTTYGVCRLLTRSPCAGATAAGLVGGRVGRGQPCHQDMEQDGRRHTLIAAGGRCALPGGMTRLRLPQPPCGSLSSRGNLGCRKRSNCGDGRAAGTRLSLVDPPLEESEAEAE